LVRLALLQLFVTARQSIETRKADAALEAVKNL
jgi:hypothetical protein